MIFIITYEDIISAFHRAKNVDHFKFENTFNLYLH